MAVSLKYRSQNGRFMAKMAVWETAIPIWDGYHPIWEWPIWDDSQQLAICFYWHDIIN